MKDQVFIFALKIQSGTKRLKNKSLGHSDSCNSWRIEWLHHELASVSSSNEPVLGLEVSSESWEVLKLSNPFRVVELDSPIKLPEVDISNGYVVRCNPFALS